MKRTIRINFVDFWEDFVPETSLFYMTLSQHYDIELSDTPDYIFCSVFGNNHLKYNCIKIFYTGENQFPDFNLYDYAIGFEYMTLRDRYLRLPIYYLYDKDFEEMVKKHLPHPELKKDKFCSFVYSNNHADPEREQFYDLLSQYKPVSSGGRYRNNVGGPVDSKLDFQLSHKFSIAFENSSYPGYCTEKLVQAFAACTVPIYWGDPTVGDVFNEGAFINCHRYHSFDEVVEEVKRIDNDDALYEAMLHTPALKNVETDNYTVHLKELEDFLCHIIDQPLAEAPRANRGYWGRRYHRQQRKMINAYDNSLTGWCRRFYKKYIWRHRRKGILWKVDRLIHRKEEQSDQRR